VTFSSMPGDYMSSDVETLQTDCKLSDAWGQGDKKVARNETR